MQNWNLYGVSIELEVSLQVGWEITVIKQHWNLQHCMGSFVSAVDSGYENYIFSLFH